MKMDPKMEPERIFYPMLHFHEMGPDLDQRRRLMQIKRSLETKTWKNRVGMAKISAKTPMGRYLVDFAHNSSMHGFKHLTRPQIHGFERFLVILFLLGALVSLVLLSLSFWSRYRHESTMLVLNHDFKNFNVTRPSVIICPTDLLNATKFPEVFRKYNVTDTPKAREFFRFLSNATYDIWKDTPEFDEVAPEKWIKILYDLRKTIKFGDEEKMDPNLLVKRLKTWIVTDSGLCVSFGNHASAYSTLEYWLADNWTVLPMDRNRVATCNYENKLIPEIVTTIQEDIKFCLQDPFDVCLDIPTLVPKRSMYSLFLTVIEVSVTQEVRRLSISQRSCKIREDGGLKMWPIYTTSMCILECRYNLIRELCGCYPHFARPMPNVPICNWKQLRCIGDHSDRLLPMKKTDLEDCNCHMNCEVVFYRDDTNTMYSLKQGSPENAAVSLTIDFPFDKFEWIELFGFNNFLSAVGGAAGLFLGASVLSFVEILYYATLKLFWYKIGLKKKQKEGKALKKSSKLTISQPKQS